ncbi:MAG: glycerophosphodiester phosphodiesterase [Alphaproteobacteria bacterium]|nr:glycerophosphodiester phosphodiesterase [Alphaproteobacteria bacterium]
MTMRIATLLLASLVPAAAGAFDLQGHRGARGLAPENTLPAFARALGIGVTTLELDVGVTKDGVVVVMHDRRLNPDVTRDAEGKWLGATGPAILDLSFEELRRYDVGRLKPDSPYARQFAEQKPVDGTRAPRLSDVFALVAKSGNASVRFNIETKLSPAAPAETLAPEPFARALIAEIRKAGMQSRATVQSFDWRTLQVVQKEAPEIGTVYLTIARGGGDNVQVGKPGTSPWLAGFDVDDHGGSVPATVRAAGGRIWSPFFNDLDPASLKQAKELGLLVVPWTVNDEPTMRRLVEMGVDGLISDYPDRLRKVLVELDVAVPAPTPVEP